MSYSHYYTKWNIQNEKSITERVKRYLYLLDELNISKTNIKNALDIGCGDGVFSKAQSEYGILNCTGIDIDETQIALAKKNFSNCIQVNDSMEYLHENKNQYDLVTLFDVLEHIPKFNQVPTLIKIRESLTENGILVLKVPNANFSFGLRFRYNDWTHECTHTEDSIEHILLLAGFKEIEISEAEPAKITLDITRPANILKSVLRKMFRMIRRTEAIVELGTNDGLRIPLSPNIMIKVSK